MKTTYLSPIASKLAQFYIKKHPVKQDDFIEERSKIQTVGYLKFFIIIAVINGNGIGGFYTLFTVKFTAKKFINLKKQ